VLSGVGLGAVYVGSVGGVKLVLVIGISGSSFVMKVGSSMSLIFGLGFGPCELSGVLVALKSLWGCGGIRMVIISKVICGSVIIVGVIASVIEVDELAGSCDVLGRPVVWGWVSSLSGARYAYGLGVGQVSVSVVMVIVLSSLLYRGG